MIRFRVDPRLRVLYLGTVAVGIFLLSQPWAVGVVCLAQLMLWFAVGLRGRPLLRQLAKLWLFAALIVLSYALSPQDLATDRWLELSIAGAILPLNTAGAWAGLLMVLRLVTVVLASQVARAGDVRAVSAGLRTLGLPRTPAVSIDTVLALFGDGGGRGTGTGRGDGRGGSESGAAPEGFWASVRRLGRGDVSPIVRRLEHQIARAERHAREQDLGPEAPGLARDIGVIAGISLTMLGVRALRVLPSVPLAPGHKLVVLTPLYVVAAILTRNRFGATLTGGSMGTTSFLMGQGRYGIFEIAKHIAPGVICDLGVPVLTGGARVHGGIVWSLFGGVVAIGRFATIFAMTLALQAPAVAYAILVPGLVVHVTFGLLSGYVTSHLVRGVQQLQASYERGGSEVIG